MDHGGGNSRPPTVVQVCINANLVRFLSTKRKTERPARSGRANERRPGRVPFRLALLFFFIFIHFLTAGERVRSDRVWFCKIIQSKSERIVRVPVNLTRDEQSGCREFLLSSSRLSMHVHCWAIAVSVIGAKVFFFFSRILFYFSRFSNRGFTSSRTVGSMRFEWYYNRCWALRADLSESWSIDPLRSKESTEPADVSWHRVACQGVVAIYSFVSLDRRKDSL